MAATQLKNATTNQKTVGREGVFEMKHYCGGMYGGDNITSFGYQINWQKLMKEKNMLWP